MLTNNKIYLTSNDCVTFDQYYRYTVDAPIYEVKKKKGVNITCFLNSEKFATSIQIEHAVLMQLIGSELHCQSSIDKDLKCGVFKGIFEPNKINSIICDIIQGFLLCQSCDTPEVVLYLKKNKLRHKCKACGVKSYIKTELEPTRMYEIIKNKL